MTMVRNGMLEFYDDEQLVVATPSLTVFGAALSELGVSIASHESDPVLGLTLCQVPISADVESTLRQDSELVQQVTMAKWPDPPGQPAVPSTLDLLSAKLRNQFRGSYAQWVPEFGKNRMISPVRGLPYVGGGDSGDPCSAGYGDPQPDACRHLAAGGEHHPAAASLAYPRPEDPGRFGRVGIIDTSLYPHEWLAGAYKFPANKLLPGSRGRPPASGGRTRDLRRRADPAASAGGAAHRPVGT